MFKQLLPSLIATLALTLPAFSQNGDLKDKAGTVQKEVWKDMDVPPAPILSPEEALASIRVKEGFSVELVAAEPLVNDPVAITWDEAGRIWAVEMWAYMPNVDGTDEDQPVSRVVVLEDVDHDGVMDKSTVFLDKLVMPRAVSIVEGGVLIADPPTLWYCQDTDGDLICDKKTPVLQYAARGNAEHAENGLMRNIDNWLYNTKSNRRLKFNNGKVTVEETHFRGQWGLTFDDYGRIFYNTNSVWAITDNVPWESVNNNPGHTPTAGFESKLFDNTNSYTYSDRINPGVNRGYTPNFFRKGNRLKKATAACGPSIYRGDKFPKEFYNNLFVPEPSINSVARFTLQDEELEVIGSHKTEPHPHWGKVEFLGSTDERFRPVNAYTGPDGNLYIVDMYRGIIQHRTFLTTFLRKQIIERGLDKPVGLGRIYRVVHNSNRNTTVNPIPAEQSPNDWVADLTHPNAWQRETAQRLLVESAPLTDSVIAALRELLNNKDERTRIHAIWTLHGAGEWSNADLTHTIADSSAWVRTHALRASVDLLTPTNSKVLTLFQSALSDNSARVRRQAFSSLHKAEDSSVITQAWLNLDETDQNNPYFIDCFISNASDYENEIFQSFNDPTITQKSQGTPKALKEIVIALFNKGDSKTLRSILNTVDLTQPLPWHHKLLFEAITQAAKSKRIPAIEFDTQPEIITKLKLGTARQQSLAERIDTAFTWEGKQGITKRTLTDSQMEQFERGAAHFEKICSICHGVDGRGMTGLAPPLDQSPWVTGDEATLIRIVAQGLMGPIKVNGETWNSIMPPHQNHPELNHDSISHILTYIRNAWTNQASPIPPSKTKEVLDLSPNRPNPWTVEELQKQPQ